MVGGPLRNGGARTTVLMATLGWRPRTLIPSIQSTGDVERVVVYHSAHTKSRNARSKVVRFCATLDLPVAPVEVPNAFSLLDLAKRMRSDYQAERKKGATSFRFNIAGGTRVMSSAALLVCILEGIPATYVHDDTYEEFSLPFLRINYADHLTGRQKDVLRFLLDHRDTSYTETGLASALKLHKSTVNHHVRELSARGVVETVRDPKDGRRRIVRPVEAVELLLG